MRDRHVNANAALIGVCSFKQRGSITEDMLYLLDCRSAKVFNKQIVPLSDSA